MLSRVTILTLLRTFHNASTSTLQSPPMQHQHQHTSLAPQHDNTNTNTPPFNSFPNCTNVLDQKLTHKRVSQEARSILRCLKQGIDCPALYFVDLRSNKIYMEFIEGITVKQFIWDNHEKNEQACLDMAAKIGVILAKMHQAEIVHGDLTTSNLLIRNQSHSIVMIDFGLSYKSSMPEDKAVDLYVLERAFLSTHPNSEKIFAAILSSYEATSKTAKQVVQRLEQVRLRGRKKVAFG